MAENNIDKALAFLGSSINSLIDASKAPIDTSNLPSLLNKRSLSGDHINGGMITNFASKGIKDEATSQQLIISDNGVKVSALSVDSIKGSVVVDQLTATSIKVGVLEVAELKADIKLEKSSSLEFKKAGDGENLYGKGLIWSGQGYTKQFVFSSPDKFFATENIELAKDRVFAINNNPVLGETELGNSVTKSNLRSLGRLQGLVVDGNVSIGQYLYFNAVSSRLGLGTEEPNAGLSICEDGIEVIIGTKDQSKGMIGTFASTPFEIVTDSTSRISIGSSGNITFNSSEVILNGRMAIGVRTRDPRADLHVAGAIKYQDHMHQYLDGVPDSGTYNRGDIVWNTSPDVGRCVGWVCVRAGTPGTWCPFGDIKSGG